MRDFLQEAIDRITITRNKTLEAGDFDDHVKEFDEILKDLENKKQERDANERT